MKKNVGRKERVLRIAAGGLLLGLGAWKRKWAGALGSIPLATGLFKYCPVNEILGINLVKKPALHHEEMKTVENETLKLKINKQKNS